MATQLAMALRGSAFLAVGRWISEEVLDLTGPALQERRLQESKRVKRVSVMVNGLVRFVPEIRLRRNSFING